MIDYFTAKTTNFVYAVAPMSYALSLGAITFLTILANIVRVGKFI